MHDAHPQNTLCIHIYNTGDIHVSPDGDNIKTFLNGLEDGSVGKSNTLYKDDSVYVFYANHATALW